MKSLPLFSLLCTYGRDCIVGVDTIVMRITLTIDI